jgi:hypothetical protein
VAVVTPLTRRATAEYRRATPVIVERGRAWYREANAIALNHVVEYGVTLEQASGILAAFSPRMAWGQNVMMAERLLSRNGTLDGGCLKRSIEQASRIYFGEDPLRVMQGPKTRAFYQAVLTAGQSETAVIDVHAWSMLIGRRAEKAPNLTQYRAADTCIRRAADIVGEGTHELQAVTWLAWRARFWSPGVNDHHGAQTLEGADQW